MSRVVAASICDVLGPVLIQTGLPAGSRNKSFRKGELIVKDY